MKKILILAALLTAPVVANAAVGGGGHAGGFGGGLGGFHGGVDAGGVHPGGAPAFYPNGFAHGPGVHYGPGWRGSALIDPIAPCYPPPYYYDPTYGAYCG